MKQHVRIRVGPVARIKKLHDLQLRPKRLQNANVKLGGKRVRDEVCEIRNEPVGSEYSG